MRRLVLTVPALWLIVLFLAPLAIVLLIAFAESTDTVPPYAPALLLDNLAMVLTDQLYRDALGRSLTLAVVASALCLLIGYPMALGISRAPARWREILLLAVMLPFWTGFLMRINAWIGLLRDDGLVARIVEALGFAPPRLLYTESALYLGVVYTYLPFMVLPLYASLSRLPVVLVEAAADLGADPARQWLRVILPLSLPGIYAGTALVFIPAVGEYVIPELLGGPDAQLIGRVLWQEFFQNRDWPMAAAVAVVLLGLLGAGYLMLIGGRRLVHARRLDRRV